MFAKLTWRGKKNTSKSKGQVHTQVVIHKVVELLATLLDHRQGAKVVGRFEANRAVGFTISHDRIIHQWLFLVPLKGGR